MSEAKFLSGPMEIHPEAGLITAKNGEIFCDYMPSGEARHEANAHLIAAAPEMYKDIEEEIEWLERLAKKCVIGSYELRGIQSRIERKVTLLARARGEV